MRMPVLPSWALDSMLKYSCHWFNDDLISCWRCCWKPTTSYRFHDTPAADWCTVSLAQFNFGEWDFCFGQWYVLLHALDRPEWVPLGGPVPPPSLSLCCARGDSQSFLTFLGWAQKLLLCLTAFFTKMNFTVYFIQILFPDQIPAQTLINSSLILKWPRI